MKICVFGAGAIGSLIGGRLAAAGADVSLVARGAHLDAIRDRGLVLLEGDERTTVHPRATSDPVELGPQDHVLVTLKAPALPAAVESMVPLLGPDTAVVTAQNGIPWWYFHALPGQWAERRLETVDPGCRIWDTLGPERAVGCVVYPSCEVVEPGVVRHLDGERLMLGEPTGARTARVEALAAALAAAGFRAPVRRRIRDDIWLKLWGNVSFNPVSALTLATLAGIGSHPPTLAVVRAMMEEARDVALRLGVRFAVDVDTRIGWALATGEHKTSMLQDLERGRRLETEALVGAVAELGRLVGRATPTIDAVLALLELRAGSRGGPYSPPPTLRWIASK
ncbi:MAG TPA: 2-dehydropantoate 2-reductase [Thermoanaerobaculia bacterium]|nr:2-dehydropantoate 2-reductase [Thermoanaerobaculia bacterium]